MFGIKNELTMRLSKPKPTFERNETPPIALRDDFDPRYYLPTYLDVAASVQGHFKVLIV